MRASSVSIFYGMDDDLRTGLVFYGFDLSEDGTIFYRPFEDRLEMYYFFLNGTIFSDLLD